VLMAEDDQLKRLDEETKAVVEQNVQQQQA
jgi:hypothetical protein